MFTAYKSFAAIGDDILNLSKLLVSSFHMNAQETPQFWRYQVRTKPLLLESYCLVCNHLWPPAHHDSIWKWWNWCMC